MLASLPGVADVQSFGDRAHVRIVAGAARIKRRADPAVARRAGISGVTVRPIAASLEDVFIDLISSTTRPEAASDLTRDS